MSITDFELNESFNKNRIKVICQDCDLNDTCSEYVSFICCITCRYLKRKRCIKNWFYPVRDGGCSAWEISCESIKKIENE